MNILEQKKLILIGLGILLLGTYRFYAQETNTVASCCDGEFGRCTGSASCSACTTCNYCKYCNAGGSCGVCSGGSRTTTRTYTPSTYTPRTNTYNPRSTSRSSQTTSTSGIFNLPNDIYSRYYLKTLMVNTISLNLRAGPGTEYVILERLSKYEELVFLAMTGNWVKVKVKSTGTIGFVHSKYVVVISD